MSSYLDNYSDRICDQRKCNGDPCQSPALRGEKVCHYHKVMGTPKVNIDNSPSGHTYLPVFEDAVSIQSAISDVCEMMLHRRIETKEAAILLYAMQVASTNMAHMNGEKAQRKHKSQKTGPKKVKTMRNHPPPPHRRQRKLRWPTTVPLPRPNPNASRSGQLRQFRHGGQRPRAFE